MLGFEFCNLVVELSLCILDFHFKDRILGWVPLLYYIRIFEFEMWRIRIQCEYVPQVQEYLFPSQTSLKGTTSKWFAI